MYWIGLVRLSKISNPVNPWKTTTRKSTQSGFSFHKIISIDPFPELKNHSIQLFCEHFKTLKVPAMKQKQVEKDYGQDLLHVIIFLIMLLGVLWYLKLWFSPAFIFNYSYPARPNQRRDSLFIALPELLRLPSSDGSLTFAASHAIRKHFHREAGGFR